MACAGSRGVWIPAAIDALFEAVERTCPMLNLLRHPQQIRAEVVHTQTLPARRPEQAEPSAAAQPA